MSAKDYNKDDACDFGVSVGELINGVRDGVSGDDFEKLMTAVRTGAAAVNEMRDVPEAAFSHILGSAAITNGDHALAKAIEVEETAGG